MQEKVTIKWIEVLQQRTNKVLTKLSKTCFNSVCYISDYQFQIKTTFATIVWISLSCSISLCRRTMMPTHRESHSFGHMLDTLFGIVYFCADLRSESFLCSIQWFDELVAACGSFRIWPSCVIFILVGILSWSVCFQFDVNSVSLGTCWAEKMNYYLGQTNFSDTGCFIHFECLWFGQDFTQQSFGTSSTTLVQSINEIFANHGWLRQQAVVSFRVKYSVPHHHSKRLVKCHDCSLF